MTVNGTGFLTLTIIQWNATALTTHFVSSTRVNCRRPRDTSGTGWNREGDGSQSNQYGSRSGSRLRSIHLRRRSTSLSPTSATAGSAAFTLTVTGTGFSSDAVVNLGSAALITTFVSATQLTAAVPASILQVPATAQVLVQEGGVSSNAISFTVSLPPPPSLSLTPPTTTGPAQQPTVGFGLNAGYPLLLTGMVTLTFASNATIPVVDPAIQFASGGTTMNFTVPPNSTTLPPLMLQTGTVAGVITLKVTSLTAAGVDVTPTTGTTATITVAKAAPVIRTS